MRPSDLVLAACLLFLTGLQGQTTSNHQSPPLQPASPATVGISAERLARIDRMAQAAVNEGDVPGLVALVARHGKIVYHKAFGSAGRDDAPVLGKHDIFRIASMSKAITATAVMMLWEEGHFQLDDPIADWIPEFKDPKVLDTFKYEDLSFTTVPAKRPITIRHLLTHSSGIGYGIIDRDERFKLLHQQAGIVDLYTTEAITLGENVKKLAKLPLHFSPGDDYSYSMGLDVLGHFVEIVSGMRFDEFLAQRIFRPLGMNDTSFYLPSEKLERLVPVQQPAGEGWVKYEGTPYYDADYPIKGAETYFGGGAGLCSTAVDYASFLQMYLNGGELNGVRLLSRTTIETMMAVQSEMGLDDRHEGLGFIILNSRGPAQGGLGSEGTFFRGGYFNTQCFADPKEGIVGVLMKQTRGQQRDDFRWQFRQLVFQAVDD